MRNTGSPAVYASYAPYNVLTVMPSRRRGSVGTTWLKGSFVGGEIGCIVHFAPSLWFRCLQPCLQHHVMLDVATVPPPRENDRAAPNGPGPPREAGVAASGSASAASNSTAVGARPCATLRV